MTRPAPPGARSWPASFADRGARVPFTTPALAAARLRCREPETVEFVVPSLAGAKGTYVVPAKAMAEAFILTPHDKALLTELAESGVASPYGIRMAALKVAGSGIAGARAAAQAKAALAAAENLEMVGRLFVIVRALKQLSKNGEAFAAADLMTTEGKKRGREELALAAEGLSLDLQALLDRLERWGSLVAPLGVVGSATPGPMRKLCQRLSGLTQEMIAWASGDWAGDAKPDALLIAATAGSTHRLATRQVAELDRLLDGIADRLIAWEETEQMLVAATDELAWCLDGWDQVFGIWDAAERGDRRRQKDAIADVIRILPMLPESGTQAGEPDPWTEMAMSVRRRVRPLEDWKTGEVDAELTKRLERYRAKEG